MYEDFADRSHARRRTPTVFALGYCVSQFDELVGDVSPFSVVAFPYSLKLRVGRGGLSVQRGGAEDEKQEKSFHDGWSTEDLTPSPGF